MDTMRYGDRVALVTGAGSGIGRAVAVLLAAEGAYVVACDVDEEGLSATEKTITEAGGLTTTVVGDVGLQADVDRMVSALPGGRIDVLANVAGIMDFFLPVTEIDDDLWHHVMAVNVTGPMRLSRAVLPLMRAARRGAIVNVASIGGLTGAVAGTAYVTSKHALIGMTRSIAVLYADDGIRANVVCPGGVATNIGTTATPRVPWAFERLQKSFARTTRMAEPGEIATLIAWLGSDEAANVNGAVMTSDGGFTA